MKNHTALFIAVAIVPLSIMLYLIMVFGRCESISWARECYEQHHPFITLFGFLICVVGELVLAAVWTNDDL